MIELTTQQTIREWGKSWPNVTRVYVFGSRARGDHRDESDLDIAVEVRGEAGDESPLAFWMFESGEHVARLRALLGHLAYDIEVHFLDFDGGQERVAPGVLKDGILLYNREKDL